MSSFETSHQSRRYLLSALSACALTCVVVLTITWTVDPTGQLGKFNDHPRLCAQGVKGVHDRLTIPVVAQLNTADVVMLGSSRATMGFSESDITSDGFTGLNLSLSGLSFDELIRVLRSLQHRAGLKRLWLGLDYGMLVHEAKPKMLKAAEMAVNNTPWAVWHSGLISLKSQTAALQQLVYYQDCTSVSRNERGFVTPFGLNSFRSASSQNIARNKSEILRRYHSGVHKSVYPVRMQTLKNALADLSKTTGEINLFVSPSHPEYFNAIEQAGRAPDFELWRSELVVIADAFPNVRLRDFSDVYKSYAGLPPQCRNDLKDASCPLFDITHFKPEVGRIVIAAFDE